MPRVTCLDISGEELAVVANDGKYITVREVREVLEARSYEGFELIERERVLRKAEQLHSDALLSVVWPRAMAREVNLLLSGLCSENVEEVTENLANVVVSKSGDLTALVRIAFNMALRSPRHILVFAEVFYAVRDRFPRFPSSRDGQADTCFTRILLQVSQDEFEALVGKSGVKAGKVERTRALLKLLCHLHSRRLLATKVIEVIVMELVRPRGDSNVTSAECLLLAEEVLEATREMLSADRFGQERLEVMSRRLLALRVAAEHHGHIEEMRLLSNALEELHLQTHVVSAGGGASSSTGSQ
eukprot:TRINITY_DN47582_c0_g1_i1.p1 TRINITY_DN47582_c0_g1~~TRINITY_DN47582_c0_g1_i1.p1  ORF type:complete len:301 (-),score=38.88 TRINITY_DN47582_c0_g1_i1:89-991(-)